jgi:hypothetical protein
MTSRSWLSLWSRDSALSLFSAGSWLSIGSALSAWSVRAARLSRRGR